MDWNNASIMRPSFVARPDNPSFAFLYNYKYDHFPHGMEQQMKYPVSSDTEQQTMVIQGMDVNTPSYGNLDKKKRLTSDQLDSLENSFQEEIKLDPDRKMKLAQELDLQPRQIAVWFQNRRARWKNKQLECLYDKLKHNFDIVSREKHKLQEEVIKLKAILRKQSISMKPMSNCYTEALSGDETVESTSVAMHKSSKSVEQEQEQHHHIVEGNYMFNVVDGSGYNPVSVSAPFWGWLQEEMSFHHFGR